MGRQTGVRHVVGIAVVGVCLSWGCGEDSWSKTDAAADRDGQAPPDGALPDGPDPLDAQVFDAAPVELRVVFASPAAGAGQASPETSVFVLFSKDVDPDSVTNTSFVLEDGLGAPVGATVNVAARSATLTPDSPLDLEASYTARATTAITAPGGEPLSEEASWSFTVHFGAWTGAEAVGGSGTTFRPDIGFDGAGNVLAVWEQFISPYYKIWSNRFEAGVGWGSAELIGDGGAATHPKIAVDDNGDALAVWLDNSLGAFHVWSSRYQAGVGWGAAALIESSGGNAEGVQIAADGAGNAIAMWAEGNPLPPSSFRLWWNRYQAGVGWGTAAQVTPTPGYANFPRVDFDAQGRAVAVWVQTEGASNHVAVSRLDVSSSSWSALEYLTSSDDLLSSPHLAVDPFGNAIVVWDQAERLWTSHYLPSSGWSAAVALSSATGSALNQVVAVDGAGRALAVWSQRDGEHSHIYASRFTADAGWDSPVLIETDDDADAFDQKLAMDDSGNAVVVWRRYSGTNSIWVNRYQAGLGWGTAEQVGGNTADCPTIAVDGAGDAMVVWPAGSVWANRLE